MGALYQQYRRLVHGLALAQLPPADVDDLVQEVFLQAMRKLDSCGRRRRSARGWRPSPAT